MNMLLGSPQVVVAHLALIDCLVVLPPHVSGSAIISQVDMLLYPAMAMGCPDTRRLANFLSSSAYVTAGARNCVNYQACVNPLQVETQNPHCLPAPYPSLGRGCFCLKIPAAAHNFVGGLVSKTTIFLYATTAWEYANTYQDVRNPHASLDIKLNRSSFLLLSLPAIPDELGMYRHSPRVREP